jgi:hypothetical protein
MYVLSSPLCAVREAGKIVVTLLSDSAAAFAQKRYAACRIAAAAGADARLTRLLPVRFDPRRQQIKLHSPAARGWRARQAVSQAYVHSAHTLLLLNLSARLCAVSAPKSMSLFHWPDFAQIAYGPVLLRVSLPPYSCTASDSEEKRAAKDPKLTVTAPVRLPPQLLISGSPLLVCLLCAVAAGARADLARLL